MPDTIAIRQALEKLRSIPTPAVAPVWTRLEPGNRVGVFSASFNPPTSAHFEIMRGAALQFELDGVLALSGVSNADKREYETSLDDRLDMLIQAAEEDVQPVAVAVSSHPYFVDIADAIAQPPVSATDPFLIVGYDTLQRIVDLEGKYFRRYTRDFDTAMDAFEYLVEFCSLVVVGRGEFGEQDLAALSKSWPERVNARIKYLELPESLARISSTEIRRRVSESRSIRGLVPARIEKLITEKGLYR